MRRTLPFLVVLVFVPRAASPQGNPVGPEFHVNTYTTNNQSRPVVASDSSGNFVVVWGSEGQDGSGFGVFGQRYSSSGIPLGPEFRVNTYTTSTQYFSSVASDASGNFVVVWQAYADGSYAGVFGQRFDSSGVPLGSEFRVNTTTSGSQTSPAVTSDPSGNFVVVWDHNPVGVFDSDIRGQRFGSSGAPLGPEFRINTFTTDNQLGPSITSDSSGNFVVVWSSNLQDGSGFGVFGQRYASTGSPLGPEFRVNTFIIADENFPSVTANAAGNFVIVWESNANQDGSGKAVFGQRYSSTGAPVGPEFRVNTYTTGFQSNPSVASDSSSNFVVVWTSSGQDGSFDGIFGQRYASSGTPVGPEFRVTTYTTGNQALSSVAAAASGNFVVVWESGGQEGGGAGYGIFGQRYAPIVPVELTHVSVE